MKIEHRYIPDVALEDQHTGVVDRLGKTLLVNLSLETALQKLLGGQLQNKVQALLILAQKSVADHAAQQGGTLEQTGLVLLVQGQQLTGSLKDDKNLIDTDRACSYLSDLGQSELDAPDLALASQAVFTDQAQLLVETLLLERATRSR